MRKIQFNLRLIFVVMTAIAIVFGLLRWQWLKDEEWRKLIAPIVALGGDVGYNERGSYVTFGWGHSLTDSNLRSLQKPLDRLPELWHLDMPFSEITDDGTNMLAEFPELRELRLCRCRVTDRGLEPIGRLQRLEELYLMENDITDEGVACLENLIHLRKLYLDGTMITDAGLKHLETLKDLEFLSLSKTHVSAQAVGDLCRELPKMQINYYDPATGHPLFRQDFCTERLGERPARTE